MIFKVCQARLQYRDYIPLFCENAISRTDSVDKRKSATRYQIGSTHRLLEFLKSARKSPGNGHPITGIYSCATRATTEFFDAMNSWTHFARNTQKF